MLIPLKQITWDDYLNFINRTDGEGIYGLPVYFAINPENYTCAIYPSPEDKCNLYSSINNQNEES